MSNIVKRYAPFAVTAMALDLFLLDKRGRSMDDPLYGVDIKEEYALVQEKKSLLSARLRRLVVLRYERAVAISEAERDSVANKFLEDQKEIAKELDKTNSEEVVKDENNNLS